VNPAFARYVGAPSLDLEGRPDHQLFETRAALGFRADDRRCTECMAPVFFEEVSSQGAVVDTMKFPLVLPAGRAAGVAGIALRFPGVLGPGEAPPWLRRIKRHLAASFAEPPSIGVLASHLGLHPDHLARSFKRHYGIGIHEYVRTLRVEWCSWSLLANPARSLAELAGLAGFADQSHLTREFQRIRGITPGRLREECRQGGAGDGQPLRISCDRRPAPGADAAGRDPRSRET